MCEFELTDRPSIIHLIDLLLERAPRRFGRVGVLEAEALGELWVVDLYGVRLSAYTHANDVFMAVVRTATSVLVHFMAPARSWKSLAVNVLALVAADMMGGGLVLVWLGGFVGGMWLDTVIVAGLVVDSGGRYRCWCTSEVQDTNAGAHVEYIALPGIPHVNDVLSCVRYRNKPSAQRQHDHVQMRAIR